MSTNVPPGEFLGHPKGLYLLFTTELWERFSYYAMRAILVLYLADQVQDGGLGWAQGDAVSLYGIFTGLVYLTPLLGGWLADNLLGQRKSIILGGILMAAGHFVLATPHTTTPGMENTIFYIGLALLIAGNGLFKPNISTMVGDLYEEGDHRRDGAFTIFYMGINVGAMLSGIVVGIVAAAWGWQAGFIAAGTGMLLSLVIQVLFAQKYLGDIGVEPAAKRDKREAKEERDTPLTKEEFDRLKVIVILGVFTVIFWAGFEQAGGLMNLYTETYTDRNLFGWEIPTTFFQSLNPIYIVILAPIFSMLWIKMGPKEPTSPIKFAVALLLLAVGFLFMIGAVLQQGGDETVKTSMFWLLGAYLFHTMGELCLSPIGLSMVTKLAPLRLMSFLMGVWFTFIAVANYVGGLIGSMAGTEKIGVDGALNVFAGIGITAAVAAVILYFMADKLVYWMHGAEGNHHSDLKEELETASQHA
ncbi:MAG: peptide MFS transporter [Kangiellaceae bacterium]|nr:peptide MFS transporter [Kangiellaceae bacterium]MCW9015446.1 peptide MFS transporter [Kangiellaceae bacterium]